LDRYSSTSKLISLIVIMVRPSGPSTRNLMITTMIMPNFCGYSNTPPAAESASFSWIPNGVEGCTHRRDTWLHPNHLRKSPTLLCTAGAVLTSRSCRKGVSAMTNSLGE
jgi:hypothetical protein